MPVADYAEVQKAETLAQHKARVEQRTPIEGRVLDPINMVGSMALIEEVGSRDLYVDSVTITDDQEKWKNQAKCKETIDVNFFFPNNYREGVRAREFCKDCQVKQECLDYSIAMGLDHGIWGGASERERRKIRRENKKSIVIVVNSQQA